MKKAKIKKLGNCFRQNSGGSYSGNVYDPNYIAPTLNCMGWQSGTNNTCRR